MFWSVYKEECRKRLLTFIWHGSPNFCSFIPFALKSFFREHLLFPNSATTEGNGWRRLTPLFIHNSPLKKIVSGIQRKIKVTPKANTFPVYGFLLHFIFYIPWYMFQLLINVLQSYFTFKKYQTWPKITIVKLRSIPWYRPFNTTKLASLRNLKSQS